MQKIQKILGAEMCKKIPLVLFLFSTSAIANESNIFACKMGSREFKHYAYALDLKLQIIESKKSTSSNLEYQSLIKGFANDHEDFKDRKYSELRNIFDKWIKDKALGVLSAEAQRTMIEATIDIAHNVAVENALQGSLGKTTDHYERKIYDACIK